MATEIEIFDPGSVFSVLSPAELVALEDDIFIFDIGPAVGSGQGDVGFILPLDDVIDELGFILPLDDEIGSILPLDDEIEDVQILYNVDPGFTEAGSLGQLLIDDSFFS